MFNNSYKIKGEHADRVRFLVSTTEGTNQGPTASLIRYGYDILLICPALGSALGKRSTERIISKDISPFEIPVHQVIKNKEKLETIFKLIILTEKSLNLDPDGRVDLVFKAGPEKLESYKSLFNEYLLGGIDYLYEFLTRNAYDDNKYIENMMDLVEEFNIKFGIDLEEYI